VQNFVHVLTEQKYKAYELEQIFYQFFSWGMIDCDGPADFKQLLKARTLANAMIVSKMIGVYYHPMQYGEYSSVIMEFIVLVTRNSLYGENAMSRMVSFHFRYYITILLLIVLSFLECMGIQRDPGWDIPVDVILNRIELDKNYPNMLVSEENSCTRFLVYEFLMSTYCQFDRNIALKIESLIM
jgi:hypothetical protein